MGKDEYLWAPNWQDVVKETQLLYEINKPIYNCQRVYAMDFTLMRPPTRDQYLRY